MGERPLLVAEHTQLLDECTIARARRSRLEHAEAKDFRRPVGCSGRERQWHRRAGKQRKGTAAVHSITSSARARIAGGIWDSKPRSLSLSETIVTDRPIAGDDSVDIKLIVTRAASKTLARTPRREREALLDTAEAFAVVPFAADPAAAPLRGQPDVIRLRQGDWRGICRVDRSADTIVLETVAHRREAYR